MDYKNDHDRIQDRFNGVCHRNKGVDEPEKNTHHNQGNQKLAPKAFAVKA
jgi:hypothetical protein